MEEIAERMLKYAEIVSVLEKNDISWNGLVNGLVETYHNDNPEYKLKQNPDWWNSGSKEQVIDSVMATFSRQNN